MYLNYGGNRAEYSVARSAETTTTQARACVATIMQAQLKEGGKSAHATNLNKMYIQNQNLQGRMCTGTYQPCHLLGFPKVRGK
jgi:hypothetical protein